MANRYWVGGTGNTNDTARWSNTSGGTGGFSVPTSADAVFFDANSGTGTATVNAPFSCASLDFTGYTGTFAVSQTISLYGSLTLSSGMTLSETQTLTFLNAAPATITTAGKTVTFPITFDTASSVGLADDFTSNNTSNCFSIRQGTINTNNYSITGAANITNNASTAGQSSTFNLGSSTVTLVNGTTSVYFSWTPSNGTHTVNCGSATCNVYSGFRNASAYATFNLQSSTWTAASRYGFQTASTGTVNEGTSTINLTSMNTSSMPLTDYLHTTKTSWYNLNISGMFGTVTVGSSSLGGYSFNNLSITSTAAAAVAYVQLYKNLLVNGTLTLTGANGGYRLLTYAGSGVYTNPSAYPVTITAAAVSLTNVDFRAITAAGAATWSGTTVGNRTGNSGITFTTPVNRYAVVAGAWESTATWSTTSGGAGGASVPLPQDTVYFDANSAAGTYLTPVFGCAAGNINFTGFTRTFGSSSTLYCIGNVTLGSSGTYSLSTVYFSNIGTTVSVTSNGKTLNGASASSVYAVCPSGGVTFADAISFVGGNLCPENGTVTFNGAGTNIGSILPLTTSGSASLVLNANITTTTGLVYDGTSYYGSTLSITPNTYTITVGTTIAAGVNTWSLYDVVFTNSATISSRTNALTCRNLTINPTTTTGYTYRANLLLSNLTVTGTFSVTSPAANKRFLIGPTNRQNYPFTSTTCTITAAAVSINDCDFTNVTGAGTATWSGTRVGDAGGNSGITFASPKTVYWNLAAGGDLISANGWAATSGGAPAVTNTPLPQDTGVIEDTGLNSGATVYMSQIYPTSIGGISFSTRTLPVTLSVSTGAYMLGNLTLSSAVTVTGNAFSWYNGTLNTAGVSIPGLYVYSYLTLGSNVTTNGGSGNYGSLTLGSYTFTVAGMFQLGIGPNYATPTLAFGTGQITSTATSGTAWYQYNQATISGSRTVNITGAGKTFNFNSLAIPEAGAVDFNISGTGTTVGLTYCRSLNFTGFTGTLSGSPTIYGSLTLVSGMTVSGFNPTFAGTGSNTITSAGKTVGNVTVNCTTGSISLNDALACAGFTIASGTFTTNNYGVTASYMNVYSGATVNLGSSTLLPGSFSAAAGATVNAGTSSISGTNVNGVNHTLYDVIITTSGNGSYYGITSCRNLTINPGTSSGTVLNIGSTTVTGTLTCNGDATYRTLIRPYILTTTPQTITAAAVSLSNTDFVAITGAGAATWSGTGLANGDGNSGITFDVTPRTLYWVGGTGTLNQAASKYSLSSGGAGGEAYPKICDTVVLDANSGSGTITGSIYIGTLTCSGYAGALGGNWNLYKNATFNTGITGTFLTYLEGYNSTLDTGGRSMYAIYVANGGSWSTTNLASNVTCTNSFSSYYGTLNTNNYNITCDRGQFGSSGYPVANLGSSVITVTGTSYGFFGSLTINPGTSEFIFTSATTVTLQTNGQSLNKVTYAAASSGGVFTINGGTNTIANLSSTATGAHTIRFLGASTNTINDWNISGTAGNLVTVTSTTTSQFTLVSGGDTQVADYLSLSYSVGSPSNTWYAGLNSVDGGNNTGWLFENEPTFSGNGLLFGSNF